MAARIRRRGKTRLGTEGTYTRFLKVEFPRAGKRDGTRERERERRKKEREWRERERERERE